MASDTTYKLCDQCGADCCMHEIRDDEPCWGAVSTDDIYDTDDEVGVIVHACVGHRDYRYSPKPIEPRGASDEIQTGR